MITLSKCDANSVYLKEIVEWLNDKSHVRFSNQRFLHHTLQSQRSFLESIQNGGHEYLLGFDDKRLVGTATILHRYPHKTSEVGLIIARDLQGKGYGKKLFGEVCNYAFRNVDVEKLRSGCLSVNMPMVKILESCGFKKEAIFKKEEIFEGSRVDTWFYAKHRTEIVGLTI